jgi:hypothetical protein
MRYVARLRGARQWNSPSSTLACKGDLRVSALDDAINQNTPGTSQLLPQGLSWDTGFLGTSTLTPAPAGWSALTAWGVVYPQAGAPASPNAASDTAQIENFKTYVHLTNGTWVLAQDQAQGGIGGAHYLADFSSDANIPWNQQTLSDGSTSFDAPPAGYNDHFWPTSMGTFTPGTVDGVFIEADMKTNDPSANLIAQLGADWWINSTASWAGNNVNNTGVGENNWTKLTTQWQHLYYTSLSPQQLQADPPPGLLTASQPATTPSVTQVVASPTSGIEYPGNKVTLTLDMSETVTVSGTPTLTLNDGGTATYTGGSGTNALTFSYTVGAGDTPVSALAVTQANLPNGATVQDAGGNAADLSGAVTTLSGLQVDPPLTTPAVTQLVASPASGIENVGKTVNLTLDLNEAVTVTGTPTLTLNDGGTATYQSGSGTSALTFSYTVGATDTSTSALAVTAVNLPGGASVTDAAGTVADLSGAVNTLAGVQIDTTTPAVTQVVASPTSGIENVGKTVNLALDLNEAVTVTGTPTLTLNDGGTATYQSGSGTSALTFSYTVGATDTSTSALAVTAVNLPSSATVTNAAGTAADLSGAKTTLTGLQVDTTPPPVPQPQPTQPSVSGVVASPSSGIEHPGDTIGLTLDFNEAVTVTGTPTLSLNDGGTAIYSGGSGTNTLTFSETVGATDKSTSALAITGVNLPSGATITDAAGTAADLSGAKTTLTGLQVDTTPAPVPQPQPTQPSVSGVVASPSSGIEHPGDTIGLTLDFNEAVTVTGQPTLSLNDGGTAIYSGGSGTNTLTFSETVGASDKSTSALAITGVNLPSGATITDAAGTAADLSGAVTTFPGLQIDPPTPADAPTLSIENPSLSVSAGGGKVDLGISVTAPDSANASVTISGLPRYETITDNLDHKTFHGSSITLSMAEVDSGLTLQSNYHHFGNPVATLTVTAHDSTAGGSASSASQTITVTDPPATSSTTHSFDLFSQYMSGDFNGNTGQGQITSHSPSVHNDWVLASSRH